MIHCYTAFERENNRTWWIWNKNPLCFNAYIFVSFSLEVAGDKNLESKVKDLLTKTNEGEVCNQI